MNLVGQFIIVPLSFAALLTRLIQSLGTHWGLFRHYWVVVKFTLAIGATFLLLLHQFTAVTGAARRVLGTAAGSSPNVGRLGTQLVFDAVLAMLVLLLTTILSVYKPWGRTLFGRRVRQQNTSAPSPLRGLGNEMIDDRQSLGLKVIIAIIAAIMVGVVVLHLTGRGLGGHGM